LEGSEYAIFKKSDMERVDATSVSWDKIKGWLASCDKHSHAQNFLPFGRERLLKLKLRLIDVTERCLVTIPTEGEYAALSYRWGGVLQPCLTPHNLDRLEQPGALDHADACSKTVRDAMQVCQKVGVRYLWVDALCIMQNKQQKSLHIANMDVIYASAAFTIVPADSWNADHGIHGVSLNRRQAHLYDYDQSWFVFGVSSIIAWIFGSPWAQRPWTYQEITLSRRLLVFTEELCCLVCPEKVYREDGYAEPPPPHSDKSLPSILLQYEPSFSSELPRLVTFPQWDRAFDSYQSWVCRALKAGRIRYSPLKMYAIFVTSYLRKDFTKSDDILEAFCNILAALVPRMGQFWYGLPRCHLLESLTWHYDEIPVMPGEFHRTGQRFHPISRRKESPSWSWTGWVHCPRAGVSLTSCAFVETRITRNQSRTEPEMISVYARDQSDTLFRVNRSGSACALFDSELNEKDEDEVYNCLSKLIVPLDTLLIFKTIVLKVQVAPHSFHEKGGWAMFPIADGDNKLNLSCGRLTVAHLEVAWRETQGSELTFAILGIFPCVQYASMRVIALVLDYRDGVYYRQTSVALNICIPVDQFISNISRIGESRLIILG
jgi:hypothetical protein